MTTLTHNPLSMEPTRPERSNWIAGGVLAIWAALAGWGIYSGALGNDFGLFGAVLVPIASFLLALALVPGVRRWALSISPVTLVSIQHYRVLGGVFLVLMLFGHLPAFFAIPAGLGDVAVGVGALFILRRITANPRSISHASTRVFHVLGLTDFVVAVGSGQLARVVLAGEAGGAGAGGMANMSSLPLGLIPGFLVPMFATAHIIALYQSVALRPGHGPS